MVPIPNAMMPLLGRMYNSKLRVRKRVEVSILRIPSPGVDAEVLGGFGFAVLLPILVRAALDTFYIK